MIYYLLTFLFAFVAAKMADIEYKRKRNKIVVFWLFLSALLFSLLAGMRADSVGTDINHYAKSCFQRATTYSNYFEFNNSTSVDFGYAFLAFILTRFTDELAYMLFFSQLLIIMPLYIAAYIRKKQVSFAIISIIYSFWFYCFSLNIMRQSIACAFLVLAITLLENKKIKETIICLFIAFSFHITVIFGVMICFVCMYVLKGNKLRTFFKKVLLVVMIIFFMIAFSHLLSTLAKLGLIPQKYLLGFSSASDVQSFSLIEFLLRAVIVFFPIILRRIIRTHDNEQLSWIDYMMIVGYVLSFGKLISNYLTRLVYYSNYFALFSISENIQEIKKRQNRFFIITLEVLSLLVYWYEIYYVMGWHEVFPFIFRF